MDTGGIKPHLLDREEFTHERAVAEIRRSMKRINFHAHRRDPLWEYVAKAEEAIAAKDMGALRAALKEWEGAERAHTERVVASIREEAKRWGAARKRSAKNAMELALARGYTKEKAVQAVHNQISAKG